MALNGVVPLRTLRSSADCSTRPNRPNTWVEMGAAQGL